MRSLMSVRKEVSSMEAPCSSGSAAEQFFVADWAALQSVSTPTCFSSYNVGNSNIPTIERLPSFSCFGSESLSEIMNSFGLPESTQTASAISMCAQDFPSTIGHGTEKNLKEKKRKKVHECGGRQSHSPVASDQNLEVEQQKDVPIETSKSPVEKDEKKQKNVVSPSLKENSDSAKEDYIHVRAKRGQATNSHSLAERVRREKISERMRLLQDIVPGCNKITGKTVMLDEIINYVRSLQRQVEFLSMKLATVNPEINLDIEQIYTKENLHSRYGGSSALGYCPQMGTSHPQLQPGMANPSLPNSRDLLRTAATPQISQLAQISTTWDNDEFQNALQMGLIPNLPHNGMELDNNGSMKLEL